MEHSSRGDLQLLYPAVISSKLPVMSSACRNCPRSAIQAQEEVLDPWCEPYAQPSPSLAFFTRSKKAWDWMSNGILPSHSLAAFSCHGGQSLITHPSVFALLCSLFGLFPCKQWPTLLIMFSQQALKLVVVGLGFVEQCWFRLFLGDHLQWKMGWTGEIALQSVTPTLKIVP